MSHSLGLCIYHLFVRPNFNLLHNSQWITFLTQSCLIFYSLCACFLRSLIMWFTVSSLSPHNLYLLFCRVLLIFALMYLVIMVLFCAANNRDSVSLLRFPLRSHVYAFNLASFWFKISIRLFFFRFLFSSFCFHVVN